MMRFFIVLFVSNLLLTACAPMNSEFSCNATAGDSCLTIEDVDALTRNVDTPNSKRSQELIWTK